MRVWNPSPPILTQRVSELLDFERLVAEKEEVLENTQLELSIKREELESFRTSVKEEAEKVALIEKEISSLENQIGKDT